MSGTRSLFRSPKFADGITSETTDESGVNAFAAGPSCGACWRFEADLSEAGEPGGMKISKACERGKGTRPIWLPLLLCTSSPQWKLHAIGCILDPVCALGCRDGFSPVLLRRDCQRQDSAVDHQRFLNAKRRY